jgi:tRNA (guanine-N7-)-methyltransferase
MINPDDFIISRKRKKYRFAKFANSPLCFEFNEWEKQAADIVEIGAGTSLFSVELAIRHPDMHIVAVDVKGDRLQKGALEAESRGLKNIQFLRARADQLADLFTGHSIKQIWLTFPDPFPKKSSAGRRLTHPTFLSRYQSLLTKNGALLLKHDSRDFILWSLEQLVKQKWVIKELSFDLHESDLSDEYKIITTYEMHWLKGGSTTNFVKANHEYKN